MERVFYIAQILSGLNAFCGIFAVISTIAMVVTIIGTPICKHVDGENSTDYPVWKVVRRYSIIFGIIFITASITIPSKKTYLLMMSGRVIDQAVVGNPDAKDIPDKTVELLNVWLDNEIQKNKSKTEDDSIK